MSGSLAVVGTGIRGIAQTSPEAVERIRRAGKVYYMLGDPLVRYWLVRENPTAESLIRFYASGKNRAITYREVADFVVGCVERGDDVCYVTTGHPGVFSQAAHDMVRRIRAQGGDAVMLPGVSAEDCLFADLGIDPAPSLQSYEATWFLLCVPSFDERSALVLWQIGAIGERGWERRVEVWNRGALALLAQTLAATYGAEHEVIVYEAARYAFVRPIVAPTPLRELAEARISVLSTLYVPPKKAAVVDPARRACLDAVRHSPRA